MNLNGLLDELQIVTGYPVTQDIYFGSETKYICYTYEDERPALSADDDEEITQVYMAVSLYTPVNVDYFADKRTVKRKLKELGFVINSIQSFIRDEEVGVTRLRQTVFNCYYAGKEEE